MKIHMGISVRKTVGERSTKTWSSGGYRLSRVLRVRRNDLFDGLVRKPFVYGEERDETVQYSACRGTAAAQRTGPGTFNVLECRGDARNCWAALGSERLGFIQFSAAVADDRAVGHSGCGGSGSRTGARTCRRTGRRSFDLFRRPHRQFSGRQCRKTDCTGHFDQRFGQLVDYSLSGSKRRPEQQRSFG